MYSKNTVLQDNPNDSSSDKDNSNDNKDKSSSEKTESNLIDDNSTVVKIS